MSPQAYFSIEFLLKLSYIRSLKHPHIPLQQNASLLQYAVLHRAPEAGQLHYDTPLQSTWHAPTHHDEYPHKLFCKCFLLLYLSLSQHTHQQIQFDIMFTFNGLHLLTFVKISPMSHPYQQTYIHHSLWNPATNEHDSFWRATHMKLRRRSSIWSHMSKCVCQHILGKSWWG